MRRSDAHIYGLDVLRLFAAILVLLNHFGTYAGYAPELAEIDASRAYPFLGGFVTVGAVGVQIFFVISGFVISMSAAHLSGGAGAIRFGRARATRLLPALWISGLISLAALWMTGAGLAPLLDRFLRSAVLSPVGPYIDGVVWTLVVEAVFYAVVGLTIAFFGRLPPLAVALALGAWSSIYLSVLIIVTLTGMESLADLLQRFPSKVFLLRHGVFFAIGMLIWYRVSQGGRVMPPLAVFSLFGIAEIIIQSGFAVGKSIAAIMLWIISMAWMYYSTQRDLVPIGKYYARVAGGLSYTVYLNHYTTGMVVVYFVYSMGLRGLPSFLVSLAAVMAISYCVFRAEAGIRATLRPTSRLPT